MKLVASPDNGITVTYAEEDPLCQRLGTIHGGRFYPQRVLTEIGASPELLRKIAEYIEERRG